MHVTTTAARVGQRLPPTWTVATNTAAITTRSYRTIKARARTRRTVGVQRGQGAGAEEMKPVREQRITGPGY